MRIAKHEDLETAALISYNKARSQNSPISRPLLLEKAELAKQISIKFSTNPGWLERFKALSSPMLKNVCGEANNICQL